MDVAIEKIAVISFFLIGISHIVQPRAWAEFFVGLSKKVTAEIGRSSCRERV